MTKYWHVLETPIYGCGGDCILDVNVMFHIGVAYYFICLLYTSDAADE